MEETLTTLEREQDERGKVESWRLHVLMEAGYPLPLAERIAQSDADTSATLTMESSGLACRYTGTSSLTSLAMNAVSCDRTGLVVACLNGQNRELRLVGSSIAGAWTGDQLTGQISSTYNVFTTGSQPVGVGSLIATHNITATRR